MDVFLLFKSILFFYLNFIVLFPFFIKYYDIMFIIIVFSLGSDRPSGLLFCAHSAFRLTPLSLPSFSVSLFFSFFRSHV